MANKKEFIEKLCVETPLSHNGAATLIELICKRMGTLDTAYMLYNECGVPGLEIYIHQLELGVKY